jgi:hypothetical protein
MPDGNSLGALLWRRARRPSGSEVLRWSTNRRKADDYAQRHQENTLRYYNKIAGNTTPGYGGGHHPNRPYHASGNYCRLPGTC